ncbi:MAG: XdhC family protein [bacterium]
MLVLKDGRVIGTVGGGLAEAVILRTAGEMLHTGDWQSRLIQIKMKKGAMQCGGELGVLLVPIQAEGLE